MKMKRFLIEVFSLLIFFFIVFFVIYYFYCVSINPFAKIRDKTNIDFSSCEIDENERYGYTYKIVLSCNNFNNLSNLSEWNMLPLNEELNNKLFNDIKTGLGDIYKIPRVNNGYYLYKSLDELDMIAIYDSELNNLFYLEILKDN